MTPPATPPPLVLEHPRAGREVASRGEQLAWVRRVRAMLERRAKAVTTLCR